MTTTAKTTAPTRATITTLCGAPPVCAKMARKKHDHPGTVKAVEETRLTELIRAVEFAATVAAKRPSSLPILECVLLSPGLIRATNLEVEVEIAVPWLDIPPVCVPVDRLKKALKLLKSSPHFEVKNFNLHLGGTMITGFNPAEYPAKGTTFPHTMSTPFFVPARLPDVFVAASRDGSRPPLSGVFFDFTQGKIVASDGHRLHLSPLEPDQSKPGVIVPPLACLLLEKLLRRAEVSGIICGEVQEGDPRPITPKTLLFTCAEITVLARPVAGEFPDYLRVIPERTHSILLTFSKPELLAALKACQLLTTDLDRGIQIQHLSPGIATVSYSHIDRGSVCTSIHVAVREGQWVVGNGFGVNVKYALEAAQSIRGDSITLRYLDESCPLHFSPQDNPGDSELQVVIMTIRVLAGDVIPQRPKAEEAGK